jgi:hypothetical protein
MPAPFPSYHDYALIPRDKLLDWYYALSFIRSIYYYKIKDYEALNVDTTFCHEKLNLLNDMIMFFTMAKDCYVFGPSSSAQPALNAEAKS